MVIMIMRGGLGNQMFEYAFIRTLAEKFNYKKVYLYTERFQYDKQRNFSLENLNLNENVCVIKSSLFIRIYLKIFLWVSKRLHIDDSSINDALKIYKLGYLRYFGNRHFEIPKSKISIQVFEGLFQNETYFKENEELIKKEFLVKRPPEHKNIELYEKISNCTTSVCVHIRRGDYLISDNHYVCKEEYYIKAIFKMNSLVADAHFFIFSDNIDEVYHMKLEKVASNIHYVTMKNTDYEELQLMYQCKNFIISNSSFSWWAQYLANTKEKIVISPDRWNNRDEDSPLISQNWIKIKC